MSHSVSVVLILFSLLFYSVFFPRVSWLQVKFPIRGKKNVWIWIWSTFFFPAPIQFWYICANIDTDSDKYSQLCSRRRNLFELCVGLTCRQVAAVRFSNQITESKVHERQKNKQPHNQKSTELGWVAAPQGFSGSVLLHVFNCGTPAHVSTLLPPLETPARRTLHVDLASCHATVTPSAHSCRVQSSLHPVQSPAQTTKQNMGQWCGSHAPHLVSAIQRINYINTGPSADLKSDRSHL